MADLPRPAPPPSPPLGPPQVDMRASREMQAWLARLEQQQQRLSGRNRWLTAALVAGLLCLAAVVWGVYRVTIGAYAVLTDVSIARNPASPGRLEIVYRVVRPGKVYYRRTSGKVAASMIDYLRAPGPIRRSWSWPYAPGEDLQVTLWSRALLGRRADSAAFPTSRQVDIVFLIDTTGSMTRHIAELKEKCLEFSRRLSEQELTHRFALLGFGDAQEAPWLDRYDFTAEVRVLQQSVAKIKRFDGGDLPESALDALEEALALPLDPQATQRFYLVTDAPYHAPTRSKADVAAIARRLREQRVLLYVFGRKEYEADYQKLVGDAGRFLEIENFGRVLSEGRILED